jgi:predicted O-linked N-acetylglucosamine transferase (SPINDLY family)
MESDQLASARRRVTERDCGVMELAAVVESLRTRVQAAVIQSLYLGWIEHHPDDPLLYAALFNHAVVLTDAGEFIRARECLERVLSLNPEFMPALINLGRIHERLGVTSLAIRFWTSVVNKLAGVTGTAIIHKVTALNQAARVLEAANQDAAAEVMLFQSLDADPTQHEAAQHYLALRQRQCEWPVLQPWERMDRRALTRGLSPLSAGALTDDPLLHLALAAHYNQVVVGQPDVIPIAGVTDSIPIAGVTDSIPIAGVTDSIPIASVTDSIPIASVTDSIPIAGVTDSRIARHPRARPGDQSRRGAGIDPRVDPPIKSGDGDDVPPCGDGSAPPCGDGSIGRAVATSPHTSGATVSREMTRGHAAGRPGRLRVGYLSSDLRGHAVGYLMAELFGLHDRSRVEVFAYYCGPEPAADDALHARFKASAEHWVPIGNLDDATAARRIATDGIQILVDVNGYTREARTRLVASRPAPVIVNWLGYPGSTGSPYHHYIIADEWIIPKAAEIYYSEKVVRLPCYQPNDRQRVVAPLVPTRAEAGLPDGAMVYCCFNATHKITRFTFERWLAILRQVPHGVLWLLAATETTCQRLRDHAAAGGVDPRRLIFAPKLANPEHLARHRLADLVLDTVPYGAHTTCSDALWMGVPVLTLSGRSFASRVCGSLVRAAGLPDLVCSDAATYLELAVGLGLETGGLETGGLDTGGLETGGLETGGPRGDGTKSTGPGRARLRDYRDRLEAGRASCVLFDIPLLVRRLEQCFASMWHHHEAGTLPRPDLTNLDVYLEVGEAVDPEAIEMGAIEDYRGWWTARLARRQASRPIRPDRRLCRPGWLTEAAAR